MIKNADDHYHKIAQAMFDAINQDFEVAYARMEMLDDMDSAGIFYEKNEEYFYVNEGLATVLKVFRDFYDAFKAELNYAWSSATFELKKSGEMKLELGYDDVADFSLSAKRREDWMSRYLKAGKNINW